MIACRRCRSAELFVSRRSQLIWPLRYLIVSVRCHRCGALSRRPFWQCFGLRVPGDVVEPTAASVAASLDESLRSPLRPPEKKLDGTESGHDAQRLDGAETPARPERPRTRFLGGGGPKTRHLPGSEQPPKSPSTSPQISQAPDPRDKFPGSKFSTGSISMELARRTDRRR